MFETETMAELCVKQGLIREAVAMYRRLLAASPDEMTRVRRVRRIAELTDVRSAPSSSSSSSPSRPAIRARHDEREVTLEWSLPADTRKPALQVLVLCRSESGIAAERRTLPVDDPEGRLTLAMVGVHSVRAAAGRLDGDRFVPLARLEH